MDTERFVYTDFRLRDDQRTVDFNYTVEHNGESHQLTETLEFPVELTDSPEQQRSLRALHLALGVSYYKIFIPPTMVHPYAMDESEAAFWNDIWQNGLGEFCYANKLSPDQLAQFIAQDGTRYEGSTEGDTEGALLGIGGGKDSIVAGELLNYLGVSGIRDGYRRATGTNRICNGGNGYTHARH
jgi:hypothetical protein